MLQGNGQGYDFGEFQLESHVEYALQIADGIARENGEVCSALHWLTAAVSLVDSVNSTAYQIARKLLPIRPQPINDPFTKRSREFAISAALVDALSFSKPFLSGRVWGRDFITLALLSDDDELRDYLAINGADIGSVRQSWLEFVSDSDKHRSPEEWQAWWQAAGIAADGSASVDAPLERLLALWEPRKFSAEQLAEAARVTRTGGETDSQRLEDLFSAYSGNFTSGARMYLISQEPAGLIGRGTIVVPDLSNSGSLTAQSKVAVQPYEPRVHWDFLSQDPIASPSELERITGETGIWQQVKTGDVISESAGVKLDELVDQSLALAASDRFAKTLSDLDHKNDWIGIRPDVEALSTLIAVNKLEPPLSIAIFGDWGSGKTFLMRKIQERIALLEMLGQQQKGTQPKAEEGGETSPTRYCDSILQIEFNAWHYTETNLWASLLSHIFDQLQSKLNEAQENKDAKEQQKHVDKLFQAFETAKNARKENEAALEKYESATTSANKELATAKSARKKSQSSLARAIKKTPWQEIDKLLFADSTQSPEVDKAREAVGQVAKYLGLESAMQSSQTLYTRLQQFRTFSGRVQQIFGSLLTTPGGRLGGVIVIALVVAAFFASVKLNVSQWQFSELPVVVGLVSVLGWLVERSATVSRWLAKIQAVDDWVAQTLDQVTADQQAEVAEAKADLKHKQTLVENAQKQLQQAKEREELAAKELTQLTVRDQMRRFVDARITERGYTKHLGLVSMIRRDFEDLSDFMYRDQQQGESRLVQQIEKTTQTEIPTVERIVLYIDDLDRCQPERVVEVLEAVHLLMAFRLFVVVVAVDPRWVFESLKHRYPHLLNSQIASSSVASSANATPAKSEQASTHDYIEKIFHIPFWVKPMTPVACQDLVAGYFEFNETSATEPDNAADITDSTTKESERFHEHNPERQAQESMVTQQKAPLKEGNKPAAQRESQQALRAIEKVAIDAREQETIQQLAPFLGNSPRRIKRFANIYRLLKSGLSHKELARFRTGTDSQTVLIFLAIVTGAPSLAPEILANAYNHKKDFNAQVLIDSLKSVPMDLANERSNALGALALLGDAFVAERTVEIWASRVMRYGFNLTPIDTTH